ncbi:hypothetical protein KXD40_003758 [Peronospora effusa]|uniref:Uncharacterized protein n=1 Tax=Peronospora effusa TaxID=542832 RepID=A0A3M6VDP2_9STRA|nr:hypothetical protein DD238_003538 [Peronospora effusa]UIZ23230.1 hypothetical protein KXD40_003758 [Peronospora effusa]
MLSNRFEEDEMILANTEAESNPRMSFALQVRIEDKQVFIGAIDTLEQWKQALAFHPDRYPPSTTRS